LIPPARQSSAAMSKFITSPVVVFDDVQHAGAAIDSARGSRVEQAASGYQQLLLGRAPSFSKRPEPIPHFWLLRPPARSAASGVHAPPCSMVSLILAPSTEPLNLNAASQPRFPSRREPENICLPCKFLPRRALSNIEGGSAAGLTCRTEASFWR
jgi:hypothetical protein